MSIVITDSRPSELGFDDVKNAAKTAKNKVIKTMRQTFKGTNKDFNPLGTGILLLAGGGIAERNGDQLANQFNYHNCAKIITEKSSRKEWSPEEKEKCNKPYEQGVFNMAYDYGNRIDRKNIDEAYRTRCGDKQISEYKYFCRKLKEDENNKLLVPKENKFSHSRALKGYKKSY